MTTLAALAGMFIAGAAFAQSANPTLDGDETLRARYALPNSRFMEIDGTPIHYVDEGQGPAILLVHGSYSSLRQWNGWAAELKKRYRVIRFDMAPAGLSGPSPAGDYGIEANLHIIDVLTRRLGIDRFMVISTSSGAATGIAYAATRPDKVIAQIFGDAAVGPLKIDPAKFPAELKAAVAEDATHKGVHKPEFWRQILLYNIDDKAKVTPDLVQEWTDLNNRALRMPIQGPPPSLDRTVQDLTSIRMPTLILWGADDHEVGLDHADRALALIPGSDKQMIILPGCGHMMPPDCGDAALAQAMPFIDRVLQSAVR
ncbi:MAG: alpha/beta hydrolase [Azospirillaceae bacterium]|nr:alpha/beta hydrolase [Azospirillaceae bacterium]